MCWRRAHKYTQVHTSIYGKLLACHVLLFTFIHPSLPLIDKVEYFIPDSFKILTCWFLNITNVTKKENNTGQSDTQRGGQQPWKRKLVIAQLLACLISIKKKTFSSFWNCGVAFEFGLQLLFSEKLQQNIFKELPWLLCRLSFSLMYNQVFYCELYHVNTKIEKQEI